MSANVPRYPPRLAGPHDDRQDVEAALARRVTVRELVAAFEEARATVRATFATLVEAEKRLNAVYGRPDSYDRIQIDASGGLFRSDFEAVDECIERMTREAWAVIVDRLELRRMMSVSRWEALSKELREGDLPEITEENVEAFGRGYLDSLPTMHAEAVAEVFEWLRPRGQLEHPKYKRNSELEVPAKIVIEYAVERAWTGAGFRLQHHRGQKFQALENVFSALDGRGQITKTHRSALEDAIAASPDGKAETPYFRVRCYKNGNAHIEFLRHDLLAKFNAIAGGRRLRPAA